MAGVRPRLAWSAATPPAPLSRRHIPSNSPPVASVQLSAKSTEVTLGFVRPCSGVRRDRRRWSDGAWASCRGSTRQARQLLQSSARCLGR